MTDLEVKFIESTEPVRAVTYLILWVNNEVRLIEASEPMTDFKNLSINFKAHAD